MESVWWVFKTLFEKGLVYRGYKVRRFCFVCRTLSRFFTSLLLCHRRDYQVMPYSTACGTPLSNFEAGLNYKVRFASTFSLSLSATLAYPDLAAR